MNYQYTQEPDGTYTIHDVEVLQLGRWRGRGTGPDGMEFGDAEAQAILDADAEVRGSTAIRPVLKTKHRNPLGEDGDIIGFLDPFKRAGDRITATIRGLSEAVFEQIKSGRTGWLSPDIVPDWLNSVSKTTHKLFMRAVSFTGGALPAMQGMLPLASADFDDAVLEREIQLETLIGETQDAGEPDATVSFGDTPKEEAKPATEPPAEPKKEVSMTEEITATQALQDKEKAFAEKQSQWEKEREEQRREIRKVLLDSAWSGIVGKTATPAEEKAFMEIGMELSDAGVKAHIDSYKSRPEVKMNTEAQSRGTSENEANEQEERSFDEMVIERAEAMVEKNAGLTFTDAVCAVELQFTEKEKEMRREWFDENVTIRDTRKK